MKNTHATSGLILSSSTPEDDAVAVSKTSDLTLVFSENIRNGTGSITLQGLMDKRVFDLSDTTQVKIQNNTLTINPVKDWVEGEHYAVQIPATLVKSTTGKSFVGITDQTTLDFTVEDFQAPVLMRSSPTNQATRVSVNSNLILTFNEPVKAGSGNIIIGNGVDSHTIDVQDQTQVSFRNNVVTINPSTNFASDGSTYVLEMASGVITDLSGNGYNGLVESTRIRFAVADKVAPQLVSSQPTAGAGDVAKDSNLVFTFSEDIQAGTGSIALKGYLDNRSINISDTRQVSISGNLLTLNPALDLRDGSDYSVEIPVSIVKDMSGNDFPGLPGSGTFGFRVTDNQAPVVTRSVPANKAVQVTAGSNLVLTFSEPVQRGVGSIVLTNGTDQVSIDIDNPREVSIKTNVVTINPAVNLQTDGSTYSVQIGSGVITDMAKTPFAGFNDSNPLTFTVVDSKVPSLVAVTPIDKQSGVPRDTTIELTFSEPVQAGTGSLILKSTKDTLSIRMADTKQVAFNGATVVIDPSVALQPNRTYSVTLGNQAIQDMGGNFFGDAASIKPFATFSTGISDKFPVLTASTPTDDQTGIAFDSNLMLTFSEAVSAGRGNITLSNGTGDERIISVTDTKQVSFRGNNLTINPAQDLLPSSEYFVMVEAGAVYGDGGNPFGGIGDDTTLNFTTLDTLAPKLATTIPVDNATGILPGSNLVLTFNEPIRLAAKGNIFLKSATDSRVLDITDTRQVIVSRDKLTLDPATDLQKNTLYSLEIPGTVIVDQAGNKFAGLTGKSTLDFTTHDGKVTKPVKTGTEESGSSESYSPPLSVEWTRLLGSTAWDAGTSVTLGTDGAIYMAGFTQGSLDGQPNQGFSDSVVAKYQPDGTREWVRLLGGSFGDDATALTTGLDGAIYVAGFAADNLAGQVGSGHGDAFISQYQPDGTRNWVSLLGSSNGRDAANTLATGTDGAIYLGGSLSGDLDDQINRSGSWDAFISKYQPDGTREWSRLIGSQGEGSTHAMAVDDKGAIYAAGDAAGTVDGQTSSGSWDAFITKYQPDGTREWLRLMGSDATDSARALAVGKDGAIYMAGQTAGSPDGQTGSGKDDIFISKYQPDGTRDWVRLLGTTEADYVEALTTDADGFIYVAGHTSGNPDGKTVTGGEEAFISKYRPDGTREWFWSFGSSETDEATALVAAPNGVFYMAGSTRGNLADQTNAGDVDMFLSKITRPPVPPDTQSPQLTASIPLNTASGVALDSSLTLVFSEPVQAESGNIIVSNGKDVRTISVADTSQVLLANESIIIDPASDWQGDSNYTVEIPAGIIRDAVGNPYPGLTAPTGLSFRTIDNISPELTDITPARNAVGVALDSTLVLTFSEPVQAGTGDIVLGNGGTDRRTISVTDTGQVIFADNTVTIDPSVDWQGDSTYTVQIAAGVIRDGAGNPHAGLSAGTEPTFRTLDNIKPQLTGSVPASKAERVSLDSPLVLTFSEPVQAGTGNIIISSDKDTRTISITDGTQVSIAGNTVTVDPRVDWQDRSTYTVRLAPGVIKDMANNPHDGLGGTASLNFSTLDSIAPELTGSTPVRDAVEVTPDSKLTLTFSEPVRAGSGNIVLDNGRETRTVSITDTTQVSFAGNTVIVDPAADWQGDSRYTAQMASGVVQDVAGNAYAGLTDANRPVFSILDNVAPQLTGSTPERDATNVALDSPLTLAFSEPVQPGSGDIIVSNGKDTRTISITDTTQVSLKGDTLIIDPVNDWQGDSNYSVQLAAGVIKDLKDNTYPGFTDDNRPVFRTLDNVAPELTTSTPARNATQIAFDSKLVLTFSEPVRAASGSITLVNDHKDSRTIDITDASQVSFSGNTVTIDPAADWQADSRYTAQMASGVIQDMAGNPHAGLTDDTRPTFTTLDDIPPQLETAVQNKPPVALDSKLTLTFNEPVQPGKGVIMLDNGKDTRTIAITDTRQVSFSGNTVTIDPAADWQADSDYTVTMDTGVIRDMAGNTYPGLTGDTGFKFKTIDNIAPVAVVSTSKTVLTAGQAATVTFTFDDAPVGFDLSDVSLKGGRLEKLEGTGLVRTATLIPAPDQNALKATLSIPANGYTDVNGNGNLASNELIMTGDTASPGVNITSTRTRFKSGDTAQLTFTFDETPKGFTADDIAVTGGKLSNFAVDPANAAQYTALYTPNTIAPGVPRVTTTLKEYASGGYGVTKNNYTLAARNGKFTLKYDMYGVPDKAEVYVDSVLAATTGGFVSGSGTLTVSGDILKKGSTVNVVMTGKQKGTAWNYQINYTKGVVDPADPASKFSGSIAVASDTYTDLAGNPGKVGNKLALTGDFLPPTVDIAMTRTTFKAGDTAVVTFDFEESPVGFTLADIKLTGGTLTNLVTTDADQRIYTALLTPSPGVNALKGSLQVPAGSYTDKVGNPGGAGNPVELTGDTLVPALSSLSPANGADNVAITDTLVLTFSEPVQRGTGNIIVSNGTDTRTIAITDTRQVSLKGNVLTLDPKVDWQGSSTYTVEMAAGIVNDMAGNPYPGLTGTARPAFRTVKAIPAELLIKDTAVTEGNSGTVGAALTVSLSKASQQPVSVAYRTQDGTASAGSDYTATSGTLTFQPGETSKTIPVSVLGDTTVEPDENFQIQLSNPQNASLSTASSALLTLLNDDTIPVSNYTKGQAVIDLGKDYGKLIKPVEVDGHTYYFWDVSGDGKASNVRGAGYANSTDYVTHDWLDKLFQQDVNGRIEGENGAPVVGTDGDTDNTYRFATINGVKLALPTIGNGETVATRFGGQNGTAVSGTASNPTYDDYLAIWDAYNGTGTGRNMNGTPGGWHDFTGYWSATPSASGHAFVHLGNGDVFGNVDNFITFVAVEVW